MNPKKYAGDIQWGRQLSGKLEGKEVKPGFS
jgi:hypothetical protein